MSGLRLYRRLMGEARPYWPHIGAMLVLAGFSSLFTLLTPVPLKIAVDSVVGSHPPPSFIAALLPDSVSHSRTGTLIVAACLFVLIALLKQLQSFGQLWLTTYTGQGLLLNLRGRMFRHAEELSFAYHDTRGISDSAYRIQYDAEKFQEVAVSGIIPLFTAALTVTGMVYVTARLDWQLALVAGAVVPALFLTFRLYRTRMRRQWHDNKRLESSALSVIQEALETLRVVKAFGQEDRERNRFRHRSSESVAARLRLAVTEGWFGLSIGLILGSAMGAVLFLGTERVLAGSLTLGSLILIIGYLQQLYDPLKTASKKAGQLQASLASAERVYALLDQSPDLPEPRRPVSLSRARGEVVFDDVSFAYQPTRPVLRNVSFSAGPGAHIALSGKTGAGKTTLVSLLTRFYDATSGRVLLDGHDVRDYRIADVRRQFAVVLQDPVLFSTTIAENIAYARPEASQADIEKAARAANAHEFIVSLPDGYETPVGNRGMRLSGGERQRVALARAFLKDAPILILDEPTSSVDTRTEAGILEAMERLMSGRTTFMISHRPSPLGAWDIRIDVQAGRTVIAAGSAQVTRAPYADATRPTVSTRPRLATPSAGKTKDKARRNADLCAAAASAWARASGECAPRRADIIRAREKSVICRLFGVDGNGRIIIAKRTQTAQANVERTVYRDVLAQLPLAHLRFYGFAPDDDPSLAWIFIEDAGQTECSPFDHRESFAYWLGQLHSSASFLRPTGLPAGWEQRHLQAVRAAGERLRAGFDNSAVQPTDKPLIRSLHELCALAAERWEPLTQSCADLRPTLMHGDLSSDNLRIGPSGEFYALDWEHSAWGPPVPDLHVLYRSQPALRAYGDALREFGEPCSPERLHELAALSHGLHLLAAVEWASPYLETAWPQQGIGRLRTYEKPLRTWLEERIAA